MSTYPESDSTVNPEPSYFAHIPAPVRYCPALPAAAKLFYGELTALTSKEGYCWASNSYFAALYDVDDSTIRRWLAALVKHDFIKVFVSGPKRRIYLAETAPKQAISRAKISGLPAQKCTAYPRKNARHSIKENNKFINKSEDVRERSRFVGPGPVSARQLREQERQDAASPEQLSNRTQPVKSNLKMLRVERAVASIGIHSYRDYLGELWDTVELHDCAEVWQDALDAVKSVKNGSTGLPGGLGAYFCSVVAAGLAGRGIAVPAVAGASASVGACGSEADPQPPQTAN